MKKLAKGPRIAEAIKLDVDSSGSGCNVIDGLKMETVH